MSFEGIGKSLSTLVASSLLAVTLVGCGSGDDVAGGDSAVEDRIKPIGSVTVAGKPAEAPSAPAVEPASEAPAVVAEAPAAAPSEPAAPEKAAEPAATEAAAPAAVDGQAVYNKACMACHMVGVGGAPKPGDKAAWEPRVAKGMDALMASAINGVPGTAMPARGSCASCTDEELKAAIDFMVGQ